MFTRLKLELFHVVGSITLLKRFTESLRLMVPNSSNQITSLTGSGFKTIWTKIVSFNACTLIICMEICVPKNNKLEIHSIGMTTLKKMGTAISNTFWNTELWEGFQLMTTHKFWPPLHYVTPNCLFYLGLHTKYQKSMKWTYPLVKVGVITPAVRIT